MSPSSPNHSPTKQSVDVSEQSVCEQSVELTDCSPTDIPDGQLINPADQSLGSTPSEMSPAPSPHKITLGPNSPKSAPEQPEHLSVRSVCEQSDHLTDRHRTDTPERLPVSPSAVNLPLQLLHHRPSSSVHNQPQEYFPSEIQMKIIPTLLILDPSIIYILQRVNTFLKHVVSESPIPRLHIHYFVLAVVPNPQGEAVA